MVVRFLDWQLMSKNTKKSAVPKLRFPKFSKSGGWNEKYLADCLDYEQPTNYLVSDTKYDDSYQTPVLTAGKTFILGYTNESHGIFDKNLPVIIFDDFTTATQFVDFPFKAKSSAMKILKAKELYNIKFAYELMKTISYEVGVHERHWISKFATMKVFVPEPLEQQKIADCLSSLDDLITAQSEKVDALKNYKKGLLQKLFPQDGETVPRLRFAEFKKSGDWVTSTLTEVASYENGKAHEQDITENGEYIVANSKFISTDGRVKKFTNTPFCQASKDNILMVLSDVPNGRAIAKCYYIKENDKITVNQRICKIVTTKANSKLLFYILNRNPYFLKFDDGVKQTNLSKDDVLDCPICLPTDHEEQEKVASILSTTDELIRTQTDLLEELKLHKSGLLQRLFPLISRGYDE